MYMYTRNLDIFYFSWLPFKIITLKTLVNNLKKWNGSLRLQVIKKLMIYNISIVYKSFHFTWKTVWGINKTTALRRFLKNCRH